MKKSLFTLLSALVLMTMILTACGTGAATQATEAATDMPVETAVMTEAPTEAPAMTEAPTEAPVMTEAPTEAPVMTEAPTEAATEAPSGGESIMLPEVTPGDVTGDIAIAGSSTVFPLAEGVAKLFEEEGFTQDLGAITIASVGTGGGFERFCVAGEIDIANASRSIKDSEIESCAAINRTPIEFRVGTDALAIVVSSENDFLTDVTSEELAAIFSTAAMWSDVRSEWPAENILRYSPGTDSGTFDYFVESILLPANEDDEEKAKAAILDAANIQFSEDDNVLVQGVEGSPYAIGYFGFAYYQENQDQLKAVAIDGVAPTAETAEDNTYPLSRPLFIYSDAAIMQEKPQVAAFINFFLSNVNGLIEEIGYFPASTEAMNVSLQNWLDAQP